MLVAGSAGGELPIPGDNQADVGRLSVKKTVDKSLEEGRRWESINSLATPMKVSLS